MLIIERFLNKSTTELQVGFNKALDTNIGIANVRVKSNTPNTPELLVTSVLIVDGVISIATEPQFPRANYYVEFVSTDSVVFQSVDRDEITQNGSSNTVSFVGLEAPNTVRDNMLDDLPPTYDGESNTTVRKYISNLAEELNDFKVSANQSSNANFLRATVQNEIKTRGKGPVDRLTQESAFNITRVGTAPEFDSLVNRSFNFNSSQLSLVDPDNTDRVNPIISSFSDEIISLKTNVIVETVSNTSNDANSFSDLKLSLSKENIAYLIYVKLIRGGIEYVYDLQEYKYGILDNTYDTSFGNKQLTLGSNQVVLSESSIINGNLPDILPTDTFVVTYAYIDNGVNVDPENISIYSNRSITREQVGAQLNVFSLSGFPIVSDSDLEISTGGVTFLDPQPSVGAPYSTTHPAFAREKVYDASNLPSVAGEYSINYSTGQVFVFGEDSSGLGTGNVPPVASYNYRKIYVSNLDYVFDSDNDRITFLQNRGVIGQEGKITFQYEQVLAKGVDYEVWAHNESLNELVENRYSSSNKIYPANHDITNVFSVYNETTGENYIVDNFDKNSILISGNQLPRIQESSNEYAKFKTVSREQLFIEDVLSESVTSKVIKGSLSNENILNQDGGYIANMTDTSLVLSESTIFQNEVFFDDTQTLAQNTSKLVADGYFLVDYKSGNFYLQTELDQSNFLGFAQYRHGVVDSDFENILSVSDASYRQRPGEEVFYQPTIDSFNVGEIKLDNLSVSGERFLNENTSFPIILGSKQSGILGIKYEGGTTFVANDAVFTSDMADGYHYIRSEGESDLLITSFTDEKTVDVDTAFASTNVNTNWILYDVNPASDSDDGYSLTVSNKIKSIKSIYSVTELQTKPSGSLTNLWDPSVDSFSGKQITLRNSNIGSFSFGDAFIVNYSFGQPFVDYTYVLDNLRVSYEYGNNGILFKPGASISQGDEYYVTYDYGALREDLIINFAANTQVPTLLSAANELDREVLRDLAKGTLSGFVQGPTRSAINDLVAESTKINPTITEFSFDEFTTGLSNLHLNEGEFAGTPTYDTMKFGNGLVINNGESLEFPSEAYISYKQGSFEARIKPNWDGIDNDASLTFTVGTEGFDVSPEDALGLEQDGYLALSNIYIGLTGFNPTSVPFTLNKDDVGPSPVGRPTQIEDKLGLFIWFDDLANQWNTTFISTEALGVKVDGTIDSTGEFYKVNDGYFEASGADSNSYRTYTDRLEFVFDITSYDVSEGNIFSDGYIDYNNNSITQNTYEDSVQFTSDNIHYIFDAGADLHHNRLSMFKDSAGFLNLRVWDDSGRLNSKKSRAFNISHDITSWKEGELHHVAGSWQFNTPDGSDELHLFVDGAEVTNNFKVGGFLSPSSGDVYKQSANETFSQSTSVKYQGFTGSSTASSAVFTDANARFVTDGFVGGEQFIIINDTADGGTIYNVASVDSQTQITLDTPLLLTLSNINYSIGVEDFNVSTDVLGEHVAVFKDDGYQVIELNGIDAEFPDYALGYSNNSSFIRVYGNVSGEDLYASTLGLTNGRNKQLVYQYADGYDDNKLNTRLSPAKSLDRVNIRKYLVAPSGIVPDYNIREPGGPVVNVVKGKELRGPDTSNMAFNGTSVFAPQLSITASGFDSISDPVNGKKLEMIFFSNSGFQSASTTHFFRVTGDSVQNGSGHTETVSVSYTQGQEIIATTSDRYTSLTSIQILFSIGWPSYTDNEEMGKLSVYEAVPLTQSEGGYTYAEIVGYENGDFVANVFGSGGTSYDFTTGYYELDYPSVLSIPMRDKGKLVIGRSINDEYSLDGVIEQPVFLNEKLSDVRIGETTTDTRTVTQDFNSPSLLPSTPQTLMRLDLDNKIENDSEQYLTYADSFSVSTNSVNENFDGALYIVDKPLVLDNGSEIFNRDQGTLEFWISPLLDTANDISKDRYFFDITSRESIQVVSTTKTLIVLPKKARSVLSINTLNDGLTNYFDGAKLLDDRKTIELRTALPAQFTTVNISYTPIDFSGDRFSLYKDGYNQFVFSIQNDEKEFVLSQPIGWDRNTWHRVFVSWDINNKNNQDKMQMLIDGTEGGTVKYGTPGFLYGDGTLYGSAAVGTNSAKAILTDINVSDTFGKLFVGSDYTMSKNSLIRIDNLRLSSIARTPASIAGNNIDINYNSNTSSVLPVVSDTFTKALYNFNKDSVNTKMLANLISDYNRLYGFDVSVDDAFVNLNTEQSRDILLDILNRMKPAHTNIYSRFLEELGE